MFQDAVSLHDLALPNSSFEYENRSGFGVSEFDVVVVKLQLHLIVARQIVEYD